MELDGKRIAALDHALSVVLSMRIPVDNPSYGEAKYITLQELATAIGANTNGYVYPTAVKGLLDLNITEAEVVTANAYALKKLIDPIFAYFYTQNVEPTFINPLFLDGVLHATGIHTKDLTFIGGTPLKWLTTDANGKVVFSNGPTPGSMNFVQDIAFDYPDINGSIVQNYILDLDVSTPYRIISAVFKSDQNMTVNVRINGTLIDSLTNVAVTNTKATFTTVALNETAVGNEVVLSTGGSSTATRLTGKLRIQLL